MYFAFRIPEKSKQMLLDAFPLAERMVPVCEHVTHILQGASTAEVETGVAAEVVVVGRVQTVENDVLVVEVNGSIRRPDGRVYHITHGISPADGGKPVGSNAAIEAASSRGSDDVLFNLVSPVRVEGCVLECYEGEKTPRKVKPSRPAPELLDSTVLDNGVVVTRENDGGRIRSIYRTPEGDTIAVEIADKETGKMLFEKVVMGTAEKAADAAAEWFPTGSSLSL